MGWASLQHRARLADTHEDGARTARRQAPRLLGAREHVSSDCSTCTELCVRCTEALHEQTDHRPKRPPLTTSRPAPASPPFWSEPTATEGGAEPLVPPPRKLCAVLCVCVCVCVFAFDSHQAGMTTIHCNPECIRELQSKGAFVLVMANPSNAVKQDIYNMCGC